jgi:hypothetical protein
MTVRWRTTLTANMKWPARWTSHNMKWQARWTSHNMKWQARWISHNMKWQVRWTSHDMKWQARWTFHNMKWQARWISQNEILRRNYLNYNNFILNMQISKRTTIKTRHIIVPVPSLSPVSVIIHNECYPRLRGVLFPFLVQYARFLCFSSTEFCFM